jgi:hypothetical protein
VVSVIGDGGFTMLMGELATCVKYDLNVKIIIKNNTLGWPAAPLPPARSPRRRPPMPRAKSSRQVGFEQTEVAAQHLLRTGNGNDSR